MKPELISYGGWSRNVLLTNGHLELVITLEVGPRILRYGFCGQANALAEFPEQFGKTGEDKWMMRGGHRLWSAPEGPASVELDNGPVDYQELDRGVRVIQSVGPQSGLQKTLEIRMSEQGQVAIRHVLTNASAQSVSCAAWALTVMPAHGLAIVPQSPKAPFGQSNVPSQVWSFWPYTDPTDSRLQLGSGYVRFQQDPARSRPFKMGLAHRQGWVGYILDGLLFVKRFSWEEGQTYPDGGVNFEVYNGTRAMEIESLSPLVQLEPGQSVSHVESWMLFAGLPPCPTEADLDAHVRPKAESFT